jgi:hypothetical protein
MRLQVRVRHSLGEKVVELPARGVEHPVVIGRGASADLQIPSVHIGPSHLVLFIHEGRWVVQDGPDSTGTFFDGKPLANPKILYGREVLKLGPEGKAVAIEIDPAGALAAGVPVATPVVPEAPDPDRVDWATDPIPASYYVPKPPKSSPIVAGISLIIAVGIVAGAAVFIYTRKAATPKVVTVILPEQRAKTEFARPTTTTTRQSAVAATASPVFEAPPPPPDLTDQLDEPASKVAPLPKAATSPTTTRVVASAAPSTQPGKPPAPDSLTFAGSADGKPGDALQAGADPAEDTEETRAWKHIQSLYYDADPAKPLMAMESFARDYPDSHKGELAKYRDDLFDKLWWIRIDGLCDRRSELTKSIAETQEKIKKEPEEAYKKTVLQPQLANQQVKLAALNDRLSKEMAYRSPDPPPIGKDDEIAKLRSQRVASVYEAWKKQVMKSLHDTHGQLPWANER